ncbi:MAG: DoxX family protein [Cyclobacteriaceae bacterium]|nr:MAG: DoxX family protein [Cyclobacteriaceae bacterium]
MSKRNKIIYWVSTIWLSLGMVSTGIVQLIPLEEEAEKMTALGYPLYFITLIGIWKLLGVVAVLMPGYPLLKEWAYAGFFFLMSGAVFSHAAVGDQASEYFGPTLLLVLTVISWYMRPAERKVMITR